MSLEYRVANLESAVQLCKSEIKAVEDRARTPGLLAISYLRDSFRNL